MEDDELFIYVVAHLNLLYSAIYYLKYVRRRQRRWWVRPLLQLRDAEGAYAQLITRGPHWGFALTEYCRVDGQTFESLIERIGPMIQKSRTNFRDPLPVPHKLAVTLRFLATG